MRNFRVELGDGYWYDNTPDYYSATDDWLTKMEVKYNVRYVTEWNIITDQGRPSSAPYLLFWGDQAHPRGSNYMGVHEKDPYFYVTDGITASHLPICCVVSNEKQVLFSKYRNDFRSSKDETVAIDGGREYTRIIGNVRCERVWLVPRQDKLALIPETMALLMLERNK